jgi:hypothetical protein
MSTPPNPTNDSFKHFSLCLAALFLVAAGAKLRIVQLYGSPLPLWDQWYEAELFFRPWLAGGLTWQTLFAAGNEHRIVFTRLLDMMVIGLNGRWEPMLQMTVNVLLHAAYACGLAGCLWHFGGRKNGWLICALLAPFFALPYAAENTIWAINSQLYFLAIFSLVTLAGLGFSRPGNWRWWLGLAAAVMALFTMASGVLAPAAAGGLMILRAIKNRRMDRGDGITLAACLLVVGLGAALSVEMPGDRPLRAHSVLEFASALVRNLTWPFFNLPGMACLLALPLAVLVARYFRPGFPDPRAAEFLLGFGLWGGLQSAALAYGRANYGDVIPASRYMDVLNIFVIAGLFAAVLLLPPANGRRWFDRAGMLILLGFAGVVFFGLCRISQVVVKDFLTPTRMMTLVAEERVTTLWTTGGTNAFFQPPTVRPSPEVALGILRDPQLQTILPAECLPPATPPLTGRFAAAAQWLQRHSTIFLYGGLGLFVGLVGYGLVRDPSGLAWRNIPALVALLVLLAALGFVWSKAPVRRQTVERALQYKLADYFNSVGNPERAAIHQHQAEAPEESAGFK